MKVKLDDIIFAIEATDQYTENFLDRETGKIISIFRTDTVPMTAG